MATGVANGVRQTEAGDCILDADTVHKPPIKLTKHNPCRPMTDAPNPDSYAPRRPIHKMLEADSLPASLWRPLLNI